MPKKNEAWGIDVGANAIKAVKLIRAGDNVRLIDFDVVPFKQVLTTPDLNVDETVQVALDGLMQKHGIDKEAVVVAVPGNMAFARFAKLPPVEPKKIPDIVRFEAQQQIPFPIEQVEWDYQVFQQDDSPDVEVGIFAITKERVMRYLNNYRAVDMPVEALTLSPLAVYNAFRYDSSHASEGVIYMDIGTTSTDVIIVEDGGIWLRTLPIGGNNFTEALVKQFKISFPKAEKLKREAATSKYAKQIFQAMRAVFADLVQEVQRSLGFYQSLNRDSHLKKLVGVGSTFRLPGLQKFLKQQLQIDVIRPDSFQRLQIDGKREAEFSAHALNMATAYGLALQGVGLETVSANILPSHILATRLWRAKQPWIAASAACFLLGAGLVAARHYIDAGIVSSALAQTEQRVKPVVNNARDQASKWAEIQQNEDPRQYIENIRRALDHRNIWSRLVEDINAATLAVEPQPVLLTADYEAQRLIPRNQRRRVYLDSVTARYEAKLEANAIAPQGLADLMAANYSVESFFNAETGLAPSFVVTLRGTTPIREADTILNRKLIQWFKDNGQREDRPYTIEFVEGRDPIRSLTQITETAAAGAGGGSNPSPGSPPRGGFGGSNSGGFGGGFGGASDFGGSRPTNNTSSGASATELLPPRPLSDESTAGDWRFEIEFTVKLRPPQEARPRLDNTPSRPPAEVAPVNADEEGVAPAAVESDSAEPATSLPSARLEDAADVSALARAEVLP